MSATLLYQSALEQLRDQRIAHAVDVHHPARSEVQDALAQLRRAVRIHAAMIGLALGAHDVAAAHRAVFRHVKMLLAARMLLVVEHLHDLGNDVAAALDLHPVADEHAEPLDFIHVVQRGAADGGAADRHRLERRDRREFPGAPHLHQDVFDLRYARARGILVGDCPARRFAGKSQPLPAAPCC